MGMRCLGRLPLPAGTDELPAAQAAIINADPKRNVNAHCSRFITPGLPSPANLPIETDSCNRRLTHIRQPGIKKKLDNEAEAYRDRFE